MANQQLPTVQVISQHIPAYETMRTELDNRIFDAYILIADVQDGRFNNETLEQRMKRSQNEAEWFNIPLSWNRARERYCDASLDCQDWCWDAWFLRGCNTKVRVCARCWRFGQQTWQERVDISLKEKWENNGGQWPPQ